MASDDADGSELPEIEGTVDAGSADRDAVDVRVGEYTWREFLGEFGADADADALYRDIDAAPESDRWDDGEAEPRYPGADDWARVDLDPVQYLGFHPTAIEAALAEAAAPAGRLQADFEAYCDPETTPVRKDVWTWEHYKREYYYEDDGSRPRDGEGEIERFDRSDAVGFDPDRIEEVLAHGAQCARETDDLVDERTVDVSSELDEDAFFTDEDGATTIANRYDLEKTVPLAKKSHFREVERYWVNKPYSFVVIFHSVKENEKKYYVVQPHLTRIEAELTEFLEGKLRTAIKYADETIAVSGEEERERVIEDQTYELLARYNLYEPPEDDDGGTLAALEALFAEDDDEESDDGPSAFARLLARLGLAGSGDDAPPDQTADSESVPNVVGTEQAASDADDAPAAAAVPGEDSDDADDQPELPDEASGGPSALPGGGTDLPAPAADDGDAADAPVHDDADDAVPALDGQVDPDATAADAPEAGQRADGADAADGGEDRAEADADTDAQADVDTEAADGDAAGRGLVERLLARLRALLGEEATTTDDGPGLSGIAARPEPAVLAEDADELTEYQVVKLLYYLKRDFIGYERIDGIKHDINVEDISCDGYNSPVFVYHSDYEQIITNVYHGTDELDDFVVKLAQRSGKGISKRRPQVDATLPDGSRAQLTLGKEVSDHGTNYTIRQFKDVPFTPIDLINWNTFSLDQMAFLWLCIENNKSLIFAGGTASGKTTSLNAVSLFIPSNSKIVSIEDTREVELPQRNWIASVTRPSFADDDTGDIDEFDLLEAALRQRPEYIVMGEIRGEEGRTLFQVMSTGHTTYTTFHADSVGEVLKRFTTDPINVSKTMFSALDLVSIQTSTRVEGNKVRRSKSLTEINHYDPENDEINVQDVYQWQAETDEFLKMGASNTLEEIKFDRGWTHETLNEEIFKRQVVLAYLIDRGLNTYTQVAATFQAFINDQETILTLMANDQLERSLEDLREMESVLIDIDPEKEEMVPRPDANDAVLEQAGEILEQAEESLFVDYRGEEGASVAEALVDLPERPDVTPDAADDRPELDAVSESTDDEPSPLDDEDPSPLDQGTGEASPTGDDASSVPGGAGGAGSDVANADGGESLTADEDPTAADAGTTTPDPFQSASAGADDRPAGDGDLDDVFSPEGDDPWLDEEDEPSTTGFESSTGGDDEPAVVGSDDGPADAGGAPADAGDAPGTDADVPDVDVEMGVEDEPRVDDAEPATDGEPSTDSKPSVDESAADSGVGEPSVDADLSAGSGSPIGEDAGGDDDAAVDDDAAAVDDSGATDGDAATGDETVDLDSGTLDDGGTDGEGDDGAELDDGWAFGEFEEASESDSGEASE